MKRTGIDLDDEAGKSYFGRRTRVNEIGKAKMTKPLSFPWMEV